MKDRVGETEQNLVSYQIQRNAWHSMIFNSYFKTFLSDDDTVYYKKISRETILLF